jgi:hypothetical protein
MISAINALFYTALVVPSNQNKISSFRLTSLLLLQLLLCLRPHLISQSKIIICFVARPL